MVDHVAFDSELATILCVETMMGTHRGQLMGVAATGNRLRWRQCHLIRIEHDGRADEHAAIRDDLGLMKQLGVGPETDAIIGCPPTTAAQLVRLLQLREDLRDLDHVRVALWLEGYAIALDGVREALAAIVDRSAYAATRERAALPEDVHGAVGGIAP